MFLQFKLELAIDVEGYLVTISDKLFSFLTIYLFKRGRFQLV